MRIDDDERNFWLWARRHGQRVWALIRLRSGRITISRIILQRPITNGITCVELFSCCCCCFNPPFEFHWVLYIFQKQNNRGLELLSGLDSPPMSMQMKITQYLSLSAQCQSIKQGSFGWDHRSIIGDKCSFNKRKKRKESCCCCPIRFSAGVPFTIDQAPSRETTSLLPVISFPEEFGGGRWKENEMERELIFDWAIYT